MQLIQNYLEGFAFEDLLLKIDKFKCETTFLWGRKFSLEGIQESVNYNELVNIVFTKAKESNEVKGEKAVNILENLHKIGEKDLERKNIFIRIFTLIKRFFTVNKRTSKLNELKIIQKEIFSTLKKEKKFTELMEMIVGGKEAFENLPTLDFSKITWVGGSGYPDSIPSDAVKYPIMRGINGYPGYEYLIVKYGKKTCFGEKCMSSTGILLILEIV